MEPDPGMRIQAAILLLLVGCTEQGYKAGDCLRVYIGQPNEHRELWEDTIMQIEMVGKEVYQVRMWLGEREKWDFSKKTIPVRPEFLHYERRDCPR